ncbi:unnamed protein product [Prorocentrum cordatum]|uniref:Uncharacterized protein n=1 Tax=Prorocentrum cordatum TaxID=2364126 RepID=A0ABN9X243_9DINO|nr:unnamed protein product [Polarella glacialis]
MQVHLTPVQWRLCPLRVRGVSNWLQHLQSRLPQPDAPADVPALQEQPRALQVKAPPLCGGRPNRIRLAVSVRATASVDGSLESPAGSMSFSLPSLSCTYHSVSDSWRPRARMTLRVSRPHATLSMAAAPPLEMVEWCEEKVHGDDATFQMRSACWLSVSARWRRGQPTEIAVASLPLGLCLALRPFLRFVSAFSLPDAPAAPGVAHDAARAQRSSSARGGPAAAATGCGQSGDAGRRSGEQEARPRQAGLSAQASLSTVSLRVFAAGPSTEVSPHLAVCVEEASAHVPSGGPPRASAVLSVLLFGPEQAGTATPSDAPARMPSDAGALSSECHLDDLLGPCTLSFSERPAEPGARGVRTLCAEVDGLVLGLTERSHLIALLQLGSQYLSCLDELARPSQDAGGAPEPARRTGEARPPGEPVCLSVLVRSASVQLPGQLVDGQTPSYRLAVGSASWTSTPQDATTQQLLQCSNLSAALEDSQQSLHLTRLTLTVLHSSPPAGGGNSALDITANIDGDVSLDVCTGCIFADIQRLLPSATERQLIGALDQHSVTVLATADERDEHTPAAGSTTSTPISPTLIEGQASSADEERLHSTAAASTPPAQEPAVVKWRVLVANFSSRLSAGPAESSRVALRLRDFSVFSWPPTLTAPPAASHRLPGMHRKRIDVSVEAMSADASWASALAAPLLSPMSLHGSVTTQSACDLECPQLPAARTDVQFHLSPMVVALGAWQIQALQEILSFSDPGGAPSQDVQESLSTVAGTMVARGPRERSRQFLCPLTTWFCSSGCRTATMQSATRGSGGFSS